MKIMYEFDYYDKGICVTIKSDEPNFVFHEIVKCMQNKIQILSSKIKIYKEVKTV